MSTAPFSPGDKVTIRATSGIEYEVLREWTEPFLRGGAQQVCKITDGIRTISIRAAHLERIEANK